MQKILKIVTAITSIALMNLSLHASKDENACDECEEWDSITKSCIPVSGKECSSGEGVCCDSKCIKKTDLCECDRYPKIRPHVTGMSHSSCGRSDDELPFSEKAKKKLLEKLAESALRIPNKTKQTIRLLNSSKALREIYIQLKYQCCEKLTLDCCAWVKR